MSTVKNPTFTFDLTQIQVVSFQCNHFFILNNKDIKYGLKINVGIHFVFTYYFLIHPFQLVPMFSGITPSTNQVTQYTALVPGILCVVFRLHNQNKQ
jgi:hypothetical protein